MGEVGEGRKGEFSGRIEGGGLDDVRVGRSKADCVACCISGICLRCVK